MMNPSNNFILHLLSDATGETLYHMASSIITQFPKGSFKLIRYPFLTQKSAVDRALKEIKAGIVAHGLVSTELKDQVNQYCALKKIPCSDWTKPVAEFLNEATGLPYSHDPNLLHQIDTEYIKRINALEFTIDHDDGRNVRNISEADIVLVGISRVSKTPTSIYLAMKGHKVANVSLISIDTIPEKLDHIKRHKVIGLTIQPKKLSDIRKRRVEELGTDESDYTELKDVIHEVMEFESYFRSKKWPVIDITYQTVEETATLVLKKIKEQEKQFSNP